MLAVWLQLIPALAIACCHAASSTAVGSPATEAKRRAPARVPIRPEITQRPFF